MVTLLWLAACAQPVATPTATGDPAARPASMVSQRTLVIAARGEVPVLPFKALVPVDGSIKGPLSLFNATLDGLDERGWPTPIWRKPSLN